MTQMEELRRLAVKRHQNVKLLKNLLTNNFACYILKKIFTLKYNTGKIRKMVTLKVNEDVIVYCDSNVNSTAILKSNLLIFGKIEQSQLHSVGQLFMSIYKLA